MNKLAKNLSTLMTKFNINASELARKTGIKQPVINRIINGKTTNPNVETLLPLSIFFSVGINQLLESDPQSVFLSGTPNGRDIPLIDWQLISLINIKTDNRDKFKTIKTTKGVTAHAFALEIKHDLSPQFPKHTILVIEPNKKVSFGDYVLATNKKSKSTSLKQVIIDDSKLYLKSIQSGIDHSESSESFDIIGIIVQSIFNYH